MTKLNALVLAGVSAALAASASHAGSWAAQDLGVLPGGTWSFAISMNEEGQIAGNGDARGQAGYYRPVLWNNGQISELPLLPGDVNSNVHGMNDSGDVVGWSGDLKIVCPANSINIFVNKTCVNGSFPKAVIWHDGTLERLLPLIAPTDTLSGANAFGVNDDGAVTLVTARITTTCNTVACATATRRATVIDEDGVATELPYLPTGVYSVPHAILEDGTVVGYSGINGSNPLVVGPKHAALWARGIVTDLGVFSGGTNSEAWWMNGKGQIVGYSTGKDAAGVAYSHAALWQNGVLTDLGTLAGGTVSNAFGINNEGQIVGYSNTVAGGSTHAVLWQRGQIIDLGTLPGGDAALAMAINDRGQIAGGSNGINTDLSKFNEHAVLWTAPGDR